MKDEHRIDGQCPACSQAICREPTLLELAEKIRQAQMHCNSRQVLATTDSAWRYAELALTEVLKLWAASTPELSAARFGEVHGEAIAREIIELCYDNGEGIAYNVDHFLREGFVISRSGLT
jgi:hypothetical protein